MNGRILGKKIDLDYNDIRRFFNERAVISKDKGLSTTMFGSEENAQKRNQREIEILDEVFAKDCIHQVLDVGCGIGRLAEYSVKKGARYIGVDASEELVKIAKEKYLAKSHINFFNISATDLLQKDILSTQFNLVLITAVFLYMNDVDCLDTLKQLNQILSTAPSPIIYLREPVAIIGNRLTLKNFYSDDLKANYNAIYRTQEEYIEMFKLIFGEKFQLVSADFLYDQSLHSQLETRYRYFVFKRNDRVK